MLTLSQEKQDSGRPATRVAVVAYYPIEQVALEALISLVPGFQLVPVTAEPPPHVLVWDPEPEDHSQMPLHAAETAVLALIGKEEKLTSLPHTEGLFAKSETMTAFIIAVQQLSQGKQYVSPLLLPVLQQQTNSDSSTIDLGALTSREQDVLMLLSQGLSNREMATHLNISIRTVEGHLTNLYGKLGVRSRTEAALYAVRNNLSQ